jgi:hypothetical protein
MAAALAVSAPNTNPHTKDAIIRMVQPPGT